MFVWSAVCTYINDYSYPYSGKLLREKVNKFWGLRATHASEKVLGHALPISLSREHYVNVFSVKYLHHTNL